MNGIGVAGINWSVDLLACKFLDKDGVGLVSGLIDCLDFCVRNNATISSNSYALSDVNASSSILLDAITQAGSQGHLFVTAAGEGGGGGAVSKMH
jgi:serine protease